MPQGVAETDVKATYKDGILEVRVPMPSDVLKTAKKIPVIVS